MHIFFDVDGVLLRTFPEVPETRDWSKDLGINQDALSKHFFESGCWQHVLTGKRGLKEALQECIPNIGFNGKPEQIINRWLERDFVMNHDMMKYLPILKAQQNVKLYIATNQEHYRAKYLWENLNGEDFFEDIYYSARLGVIKKDPFYFQQINEALQLAGETVIFFDDFLENVESSRTQGWKGYHYQTLSDFEENEYIKPLLKL